VFELIGQAVGYAHSVRIIHRDLKPANVMVGAFGEVQVMDWGLAKVVRDEDSEPRCAATRSGSPGADETVAGSAKGTPAFMPPEQARGQWDKVGPPADAFALGGILCAILTGRPPYTAANARAVMILGTEADLDPAFARLDSCGADAELVSLCKRCLAADPAHRPADGKEVAEAVAAYRTGVEERARRAEIKRAAAEAEAREQRKRRKVQLALAAAGVAVVGLVAAGAWWNERTRHKEELRVAAARAATGTSLERAEAALGRSDAARAGPAVAEAQRWIEDGGIDDLRPRLIRDAADLDMLRTLDGIDNDQWVIVDGKQPPSTSFVPRWQAAFAGYGITPGSMPPAEAAARVNDSLIRERLLTALEAWHIATRDPEVGAVLAAADPDEFRTAARATNYQRALLSRVFRGRPLPGDQPVWFGVAHGGDRNLDPAPREHLLAVVHRAHPNSFSLLMALGNVHPTGIRETAHKRAGWLRAALAVQPESVAAWNNLGIALMDAGDPRGAVVAFREAVRLDPSAAKAHSNLGVALQEELGDLAGAIAEFRETVRLDPQDVAAHVNLGNALRLAGDLQEALTVLKEAVRLDPNEARAHSNLGIVLRRMKDLPGAIEAYREAIRLDPNLASTHVNLGNALHDARDLPGAIEAYREAIRLDPNLAQAHYNLGRARRVSGDRPGAISAYQKAVQLNPNFAEAHYNLALLLDDSGDVPGAIAAYREVIRINPMDVAAHNNLAAAYTLQKQYPEAAAAAREAIRRDPKFANAYVMLGLALLEIGDLTGARAAWTEAARLDPKQWGSLLKELPPVPVAPPPREVNR
jgi:tetratricopeptide (TPR) repeat protein